MISGYDGAERLPSRRNVVLRLGDIVEKHLPSAELAILEERFLKCLYKSGLNVPEILQRDDNILSMRYIRGETLPDFLLRMEKNADDNALRTSAEGIARWLAAFYHAVNHNATGEIRGDINGRNFLIDNQICFGVDFEEHITGRIEQDVGGLLAFVTTYDPQDTATKQRFAQHLLISALSLLPVDSERIEHYRLKELAAMRERREFGTRGASAARPIPRSVIS